MGRKRIQPGTVTLTKGNKYKSGRVIPETVTLTNRPGDYRLRAYLYENPDASGSLHSQSQPPLDLEFTLVRYWRALGRIPDRMPVTQRQFTKLIQRRYILADGRVNKGCPGGTMGQMIRDASDWLQFYVYEDVVQKTHFKEPWQ